MEYEKIINLLDNKPNQPTKFRTKDWVEVNYESPGTYNKDNKIRFKTPMLRSSLYDCSNANENNAETNSFKIKPKLTGKQVTMAQKMLK